MPSKPPSLCPRCRTPSVGRCPTCAPPWANQPRSWARGSTTRWRKFRAAWLADHPLCACRGLIDGCKRDHDAAPCRTLATVVDHDDTTDYDTDRYDPQHVRSMCKPCHDQRTAAQGVAARG